MMAVTTPETAHDAIVRVRQTSRPRNSRFKNSASPRPRRNCGTTEPATQMTEALRAR